MYLSTFLAKESTIVRRQVELADSSAENFSCTNWTSLVSSLCNHSMTMNLSIVVEITSSDPKVLVGEITVPSGRWCWSR